MAATNDRGTDLLERISRIDRRYAEPPVDGRFVGYAADHWLELDFGDRLSSLARGKNLILYLYGWVEYTYSHVNYAAYQAGLALLSPRIEVPDGLGGWKVAVPEAGFPAGMPRMMTLDVTALPLAEDGRMRIRTNMEIFWDQIFIAVDVAGSEIRTHTLKPVAAELRQLGYPREYSPDGNNPTLYDYHRRDQGLPFKNLTGYYTKFGNVLPLLSETDNRFVIFGHGEEITLEFETDSLPDLPAGRARTLVLHTEGYCKDMDLYTAYPDTVAPLPYRGMVNYPPSESASEAEPADYEKTWNTRLIVGQ
jgi:hypothetical protein